MPSLTVAGLDTATFAENLVNATPQLIDSDVAFSGGGALDTGRLVVSGLLAEDAVAINSQGSGLGQISVDEAGQVFYGGLLIGQRTAGSGVAGLDLVVTFSAGATSTAVDALIQNLTYANSSDTPTASRTLRINVSDASGLDIMTAPAAFAAQDSLTNPLAGVTTTQRSAPAVADLDGDGDLDVLVGQSDGTFKYFQNTGGPSNPAYVEGPGSANPLNGVDVGDSAMPNFGDIDGDGDLDLIVGRKNGTFAFFQNTGTTAAPVFVLQAGAADPWNSVTVGSYASPSLGDLDGDGDLDLVSGVEFGAILYFRNDGGALAPSFFEQTGAANPLASVTAGTWYQNWSTPTLMDLDRDGDLDLIIGGTYGLFRYFENSGTGSDPMFVERTGGDNPFASFRVNFGSNPAIGDIDGDHDLDLLTGDSNSGVLTYIQNTTPHGAAVTIHVTAESDGPTTGADVLVGSVGGDIINAGAGDDVVDGGDGDDVIDGGQGDDILNGGSGSDFLKGGLGADTMTGGTGNDTYVVDNTGDITDETGGDGADKVRVVISWTLASDIENLELVGSAAIDGTGNGLDNVIVGGAGANRLQGLDGDDSLDGGAGNDLLEGGDGADILEGGAGNDDLRGGNGVDTLSGGLGNDRLDGETEADSMAGGLGSDVYVVDDENDLVIELAGTSTGTDTVEASVTYALTANVENLTQTGSGDIGGTGNGLKNVITGNSGANTLDGAGDSDTLNGGDGNDSLIGGAGADSLLGDGGADSLAGGDGADRLTGGTGADTFVFSQADIHLSRSGGKADIDTIVDLNFAAGDIIDLSGIDAIASTPAEDAFTFVTKFTKVAGQAVMAYTASNTTTTLQLDVDGDGVADLKIAITSNHAATAANLYTGIGDLNGGWVL